MIIDIGFILLYKFDGGGSSGVVGVCVEEIEINIKFNIYKVKIIWKYIWLFIKFNGWYYF